MGQAAELRNPWLPRFEPRVRAVHGFSTQQRDPQIKKAPRGHFYYLWWRMAPKSTPGYKPELDEPGLADSTAQQAASKHGLHVTPAVHNQINNDFVVSNTVDHSVRLEEGLPVFFDTQAD